MDCSNIDYIYFLDEHIEVCDLADLAGIPIDQSRFNAMEFQVCDVYKRTWFAVEEQIIPHPESEQGACTQYVFGLRPNPHRIILEERAVVDCRDIIPSLDPWFTVANHIEKNGTGSDGPDLFFPDADEALPVSTAEKIHLLKAGTPFCKYVVSFDESSPVEICNGSVEWVRHWSVVDWCDGSRVYDEFTQLIKLKDNTPPVIGVGNIGNGPMNLDSEGEPIPIEDFSLSTAFYDCFGRGSIPFSRTLDNCSNSTNDIYNIEIERFANPPFSPPVFITNFPNGGDIESLQLEEGKYSVTYRAMDDCGNESEAVVTMTIEDQQPPLAICKDIIHITLTNFGEALAAQIEGEALNDGSFDNCHNVNFLIRSHTNSSSEDDEWQDWVRFSCEDTGNELLLVDLLVYEDKNGDGQFIDEFNRETGLLIPDGIDDLDSGLSAYCSSIVKVEDKNLPQIFCEDKNVDCSGLDLEKLRSLLPTEDMDGDGVVDDFLFGPEVIGGCRSGLDIAISMELIDMDFEQSCGRGSFIRRFTATRRINGEEQVVSCDQVINVNFVSDWTINMPPDVVVECGGADSLLPAPLSIEQMLTTDGCDRWGLEVEEETYDMAGIGGDGACFKVIRTYRFINWCTWATNNTELGIVNRPEALISEGQEIQLRHKSFNLGINEFGDEEDADSYDEDVTRDDDGALVLLDNGFLGFDNPQQTVNTFPRLYNDNINGNETLVGHYAENYGYFAYRQIIKMVDTQAPIITQLPDLVSKDTTGNCAANVRLLVPDIEDCSSDYSLTYEVFDLDQQLVYESGSFSLFEGIFQEQDLRNIPIGNYKITNWVSDNCGNQSSMSYDLTISDGKAPTPYCIFGLSVDLNSDGTVEIFASDFDIGSFDACGEVAHYSFSEDINDVSRLMTCDSVDVIFLDIWATDDSGNQAHCDSYVAVQPFGELELCGLTFYNIYGVIQTIREEYLEDVWVHFNGQNRDGTVSTSVEGEYRIEGLAPHHDYTITPEKNTHPLNGVTTLDIIQIKKHILNIEYLDNPYSMIAADVNRSNTITTLDMIEIRKLVLQEQHEFSNNTSWRFVPTAYDFPNPANPWEEAFPEVLSFNDLNQHQVRADFMAIKIGDVNASAISNNLVSMEERSDLIEETDNEMSHNTNNDNYKKGDPFTIVLDDVKLLAQSTYTIDFIIPELKNWAGFQFTLHFNSEFFAIEDIIEAGLSAEHLGIIHINEGWIRVSYDGEAPLTDHLFSLIVRAEQRAKLSEHLRIDLQLMPAEAYRQEANNMLTTEDVVLQFIQDTTPFSSSVALYPNFPNPFKRTTSIGFDLPETTTAKLSIQDVNGRLLYSIEKEFDKGYNNVFISTSDLTTSEPAAVGLLFYTLETKWGRKTRKMMKT